MRLDAMLGKSIVGVEKKVKEPTRQEVTQNATRQNVGNNKHLRKPYEIPASILMKCDKVYDDKSTEK